MPPVGKSGFGGRSCYDEAADIEVEIENENEVNINIDVDVNDTDEDGEGSIPENVELCHNGRTIEVSVNALEAHYGHGDTLGPCPEPAPIEEPTVEEPVPIDPVEESVEEPIV